jgi:serine phosphatase RsbU (regulator of sigma subunit)
MVTPFLLYFIPPLYHASEEKFRQARLLVNTCFIVTLFSLLYIGISYSIDFTAGIFAMTINVFGYTLIPVLFRLQKFNIIQASNIVGFLSAHGIYLVIYYSGGFNSPVLPWLASTPIAVLLLAGKKSGWIWAVITILAVYTFGTMSIMGYHFPREYNQEYAEIFAISCYSGLILIIFLIALVFETGKTSTLIKLYLKTQEVTQQKEVIEIKNKNITDSINYAKKIQTAILPSIQTILHEFPDSFILYKPKDIVSGDFYWMEKSNGKIFLAVADCTGHGVPGAFMSMIGTTFFNEAIIDQGLTSPNKILNEVKNKIIKALKQRNDGSEQKDGMDAALCTIEYGKEIKLEFAGAYNPLWIFRPDKSTTQETTTGNKSNLKMKVGATTLNIESNNMTDNKTWHFIEIKGDRQPLGAMLNIDKPFTNHIFKLEQGDTLYMFTDGFADQFGGPKGKKFNRNKLKELLFQIQGKSMKKQHKILEKTFQQWKGDLDQVDDICIMGIRI